MNEKPQLFYEKQETHYDQHSNPFLTEDEVSFLEMDVSALGLGFSLIESIEVEENTIGVSFSKVLKSPLEVLLIKSIDNDLLKENFFETFDDYEVEITFDVSKKVGNRIKEYLFKVTIFKNQQLWEEFVNG